MATRKNRYHLWTPRSIRQSLIRTYNSTSTVCLAHTKDSCGTGKAWKLTMCRRGKPVLQVGFHECMANHGFVIMAVIMCMASHQETCMRLLAAAFARQHACGGYGYHAHSGVLLSSDLCRQVAPGMLLCTIRSSTLDDFDPFTS